MSDTDKAYLGLQASILGPLFWWRWEAMSSGSNETSDLVFDFVARTFCSMNMIMACGIGEWRLGNCRDILLLHLAHRQNDFVQYFCWWNCCL